MQYPSFPESGLVRLPQIVGDPNAEPPIQPVIPVSRSTWWAGVKSGRYPKPVKLGPRITGKYKILDLNKPMPTITRLLVTSFFRIAPAPNGVNGPNIVVYSDM